MFIETVPNRDSPPAVLLRESYRDENGRTQKRTLANLSKLPDDVVAMLKAILKGGTLIGTGTNELQIERSLPHGHVAAALGMIRQIALDRLILSTANDAASRRHCDLVLAMMVDRLIAPRSKLGFVRAVDEETAVTSLARFFASARSKITRPTRRWIGSWSAKSGSRAAWPGVISRTAFWCFTMSVRPTSRAAIVRWRSSVTVAITEATVRRSSTGCSARARDYRLRSRCLRATVRIRPR